VLVLENLRFDPAEKNNDPEFARELANGVDIYVNDAFGACHRSHASVVAITGFTTKSAAGFLVKKEVEYLNKLIRSPKKPYIVILGGVKVSDKIPIIQNLLTKADTILIGGAMAYTFFSAQGKGVGKSLVETDKKEMALSLLQSASGNNVDFELPEDHITASAIDQPENVRIINDFPIPREMMALDIGPRTIENYISIISNAETIFWNGPMGVFEVEEFSIGTMSIAEAVASSKAISIVGGGDSAAAIAKAGVEDRITHLSTGGGASLEYIANERLPGLEALSEK
jgi:phosphoglycerate kinase